MLILNGATEKVRGSSIISTVTNLPATSYLVPLKRHRLSMIDL